MEKNQKHPDRNHPTHPNQQDDNTRRKGGEDREREPMRTTEQDNGRKNEDTKRPREENDRNS